MNRLSKHFIPSKQLSSSRMLFLKLFCQERGIDFSFIHKYLVKLEFHHSVCYIKINSLDQEYYVFTKGKAMQCFYSIEEVKQWILSSVISKSA